MSGFLESAGVWVEASPAASITRPASGGRSVLSDPTITVLSDLPLPVPLLAESCSIRQPRTAPAPGRSEFSWKIFPGFEEVDQGLAWSGQSVSLARLPTPAGRSTQSEPASPPVSDEPFEAVLGQAVVAGRTATRQPGYAIDSLPLPTFNLTPWYPAEAYSAAPVYPTRAGRSVTDLPPGDPAPVVWLGQSVATRPVHRAGLGQHLVQIEPVPFDVAHTAILVSGAAPVRPTCVPHPQPDTWVPPVPPDPVAWLAQDAVRPAVSPKRPGLVIASTPPLDWHFEQTALAPSAWGGQSVSPARPSRPAPVPSHADAASLLTGHLGHLQITYAAAWSGGVTLPPPPAVRPGRVVESQGPPEEFAGPSPFVPYQLVAAGPAYSRRALPAPGVTTVEPVPVGLIVVAGPYHAVARDLYVAGAVVGEVVQP